MKVRNAVLLAAIILLLAAAIVYRYVFVQNTDIRKRRAKETMETVNSKKDGTFVQLRLEVIDAKGKTVGFRPGEPRSVARDVLFKPESSSANAFHLPKIRSRTVEFEGQFTGDVNRGGSCNVDILSYVPHGLTHIETSAHILSPDSNPPTIKDIPLEHFCGIVYLIDLTHLGTEPGRQIPWKEIEIKLEQNTIPISMLALKTRASLLPSDYDFSGKDFLSLSPEAAKGIHDYSFPGSGSSPVQQPINCLLLDLPSIDPEADGGKLTAHRNFFGLPGTGHSGEDREKRALVELAWFSNLGEGYYYALITPPPFQANAVSTGIVFQPLARTK